MLPALPEPLTPREARVLESLCAGLSNRQLAAELGVSEQTVKFHLKNIYGKLGVSGRTQAVLLARQPAGGAVDQRHTEDAVAELRRRMEPVRTPLDFARRARRVYGRRLAVIDGDVRLDYEAFFARCDRAAALFLALGVVRGDRVPVIALNSHRFLELFYALPRIGAVIVPINPRLSEAERVELIHHCGARVLVLGGDSEAGVLGLRQAVPGLRQVVALDRPAAGALHYEALLGSAGALSTEIPLEDDDLISINYTSGTTQKPRGVMVSHGHAWANVVNCQLHWPLRQDDRFLWLLPFAHGNGWGFVWSVTAAGATHVFPATASQDGAAAAIQAHGVTHLCAARTVLQGIARFPETRLHEIPRGIEVLTAGSAPSLAMLTRVERVIGWHVTHAYGLTETAIFIAFCDLPREIETSRDVEARVRFQLRQGVPALSGCDLRVVDEEGEEVLHDGRSLGEVVVRSASLMRGYYRDPAATARAFVGGWFHTGDAAVVHPDGYFEIRDRFKDVIISNDQLIAPFEIESVLIQDPQVAEAAVVGRSDEAIGEQIVAFVVPREPGRLDVAELARFAARQLAGFKRPHRIEVVDALAKTATGKVNKPALRQKILDSSSAE